MKFTRKYSVRWHDTGADLQLTPSRLLELLQETASLQCRTMGRDLDVMREREGMGFVLMRLSVDIPVPIHAYDEIEVDTWITDSHGLSFNRCFSVRRGSEVVALATSVWALLRIADRSFVRVSDFSYGFDGDAPLVMSSELPVRIRIPAGVSLSERGSRMVAYSDIDYNLHMNNTRYPDMLCNFLPGREGLSIRSMVLSYLHESRYGETLRVLSGSEAGRVDGETVHWMKTLKADGSVGIEARIVTVDREATT